MIKFLDLKKINSRYKHEILEAITDVLDSGWYINHTHLVDFEKQFARYCGVEYAVGVGNGLDALALTLAAWRQSGLINDGDEVIVPANTFIASVLAIENQRLTPVFVEPDPLTHNISADSITAAITKRTRVILPVHLYGRMAPMKEICHIAKLNELLVLEDCAQAHGAEIESKLSGSWGDAGAFSFYPGKNLGGMGDGGMITTNDKELADQLLLIRNYGFSERYICDSLGVNSRLDEMQASILNVKLKYLDEDILKRQSIADLYLSKISNKNITLPLNYSLKTHVWHLFVIETDFRDEFRSHLEVNKIETSIHYPIPPHKQNALKAYNALSLPITERLSQRVVSLPMDPTMDLDHALSVVNAVNSFSPDDL